MTIHTGDVWNLIAQPFTAYVPSPADGSNEALVTPVLTWVTGQAALQHHVYFGDDRTNPLPGDADILYVDDIYLTKPAPAQQ